MGILHLLGPDLDHLLAVYGYWAVLALVLLETTGIPAPGETMLITASAYAGATHRLSILLVVAAASVAAIVGDNVGFWIGREGGWRLLRRYGRLVHVDDGTLKVGIFVFRRHGAAIVFTGRFIPVLRTWGALLAGVNRYPWRRFLVWNAAGGIAWAVAWGALAYVFGKVLQRAESWVSLAALGIACAITVAGVILVRRRAAELRDAAEREFPDLDRAA